MTVGQIKNEVFLLVRPQGSDADALFSTALRGSLVTISSDMRLSRKKLIRLSKISPFFKISRLIHHSGEKITLPLTGRAYSMKVSGKGTVTVRDGKETRSCSFNTEDSLLRDFIKSGGEIELSGDFCFCVYDFSLYSEIFGSRREDIPDGGKNRVIDFSGTNDFIAFISLPSDKNGKRISGSYYEDSKLYLPYELEGEISVNYLRCPAVGADDKEEVIDLPSAYRSMLVYLTASRMLADEDGELSEKFLNQYEQMKKNVRDFGKAAEYEEVLSNGWA